MMRYVLVLCAAVVIVATWVMVREVARESVIPEASVVAEWAPDAALDSLIYLYRDGSRAGGHPLAAGDSVEVCAHLKRGEHVRPHVPEQWVSGLRLRLSELPHCVWVFNEPAPVRRQAET